MEIQQDDAVVMLSEVSNLEEAVLSCVRRSVEFFLGRVLKEPDIEELRKTADHWPLERIHRFLQKEHVFLRDKALHKKFDEYFFGKEGEGAISSVKLTVPKTKLRGRKVVALLTPEHAKELSYRLDLKLVPKTALREILVPGARLFSKHPIWSGRAEAAGMKVGKL